MLLIGILLVAPLALLVVESWGYNKGGFNNAFWQLPLDEKLDHVVNHDREWWWVSSWGLVGMFALTGGVLALSNRLADDGEGALAFAGAGIFLVGMVSWVFGLAIQGAGVSHAAKQRKESGATPAWLHPLWHAAYVSESAWIVGSNLAYAVLGAGILSTGTLHAWSAWTAIVLGILIPIAIAVTKAGFPQLADLAPFALGIAAIIEAL